MEDPKEKDYSFKNQDDSGGENVLLNLMKTTPTESQP